MKRILILYLVILALLLAGCTVTPNGAESTRSLFISDEAVESFDEESRIYQETLSEETPDGSFLVKQKKYSYHEKDLILLDVTNETDADYTVTVTGSYLDKDGNVLKTETQAFEGFAAKYQTYFLFMPKINFDSFSYEIALKPYAGECLAADIDILDGKRRIDKWKTGNTLHQLIASIEYKNNSARPLTAALTCIFFDKNGEIFYIGMPGIKEASAGGIAGPSVKLYVQYTKNEFVYPERLERDYVDVLAFVSGVFTSRDEMLAWLESDGNDLTEWYGEYGVPTDDYRT